MKKTDHSLIKNKLFGFALFIAMALFILNAQTSFAQTTSERLERAKASIAAKNYESAIQDLTEIVKTDSSNAEAFATRAQAYIGLGNYESSLVDSSRATALSPNFGWAYYLHGLASLWRTKTDYPSALSDFTKVIALDPKLASEGYRLRAGIHNEYDKDYWAALADANESIKLEPTNGNVYAQRGWANTQLKNYEKARDDYRQAIKFGAANSGTYTTLGYNEFQLKDYEQAAIDTRKALELEPNNQFAKDNLTGILAARENQKKANLGNEINVGQTAAPIDLGVVNDRAKSLIKPEYPETARKSNASGAVKIKVIVDEQGNVTKADAVEGEMLLRDASLAAARATKFNPYSVKGKAAKFTGSLIFNFVAPKSDFLTNMTDLNKQVAELNKAEKTVDQDLLDLKNHPDMLKDKTIDKDAQNQKKNEDDDDKLSEAQIKALESLDKKYENEDDKNCKTATFITAPPPSFKEKLVDTQTINKIIKSCDAAINAESLVISRNRYQRALARYYLIRGYETPLGKTLSDVSAVSAVIMLLALNDLEFYLGWNDPENKNSLYDLRKMGNIMAGELNAVLAYKDKKPELLSIALEKLAAAQGFRRDSLMDSPTGKGKNDFLNDVIAQDRALIEGVINKNAGRTGTDGEEIKNRYQKYAADYAAKEAVYKQDVQNFQGVLKIQQTATTPDTAQICQSLSTMNASFQQLKNSFAPIVEMKNKGELSDPNLVKMIEGRSAQQNTVQAQINATAAKYGCQLK